MSVAKIKMLVKDSFVYGLSAICSRMITVLLVPIYTHIFTPSNYGIINIINTTFLIVSLFCGCALDNSAARWFYDTEDVADRKKSISTWFWFQFSVSIIISLILASLLPLAAKHLLHMSISEAMLIWLLPCGYLSTNVLPVVILNWYRLHRMPYHTLIFSLSQSLFTIALTVVFVVFLKWKIKGVYAALFISSFLFSGFAIIQMKSWIALSFFSRKRLIEMLRFSLPLIPAALAYWLLNTTDAYFILYFKNPSEVGLFSIGASIASGVALFTGAFQQAWGPFAFSIVNDVDAKSTYASVFLGFGTISSVIVLIMFLFSPDILRILTTPQYYKSDWVASILSVNIILIAITYIASIGASIAKDNKPYARAIFIAAIVTILLDFLLIPMWGKEGSALATVIAQAIVPLYVFYHAQKLYKIDYKFVPVVVLLLLAIMIGTFVRHISIKGTTEYALIKISTLIFFIIGIYCYINKYMKMSFNIGK